jgi:hypothetical protein
MIFLGSAGKAHIDLDHVGLKFMGDEIINSEIHLFSR